MERTHKASGWKRESIGYGNFLITPTDDSGQRKVAFMSAGSWANLSNDDRANQDNDRIVLIEGNPLPQWANDWLTNANAKSCAKARARFGAMVAQADFDADMRDANAY